MVKSKKKSKKRGSYHKGGESARPGTLNVKCPNMDCGTAGLPGFHAIWKKGGSNKQSGSNKRRYKNKKLYGGDSARPGTLNVKCPNMDCGTAGLPGFHATWKKGGKKNVYNTKKKLRFIC